MTGMAEKLKAFEMSAVDYVTKPFEPEEVVARIDKHLTIRNLRRQLETINAQLRQEITDHKQKEMALQNSQEQLALITDNIPALIGYRYLRGRIDGLVVQMEKEAMKFLEGLSANRVAGVASVDSDNETAKPRKRSA